MFVELPDGDYVISLQPASGTTFTTANTYSVTVANRGITLPQIGVTYRVFLPLISTKPTPQFDPATEAPVPAGYFQMGCAAQNTGCSNDERPVHLVYIDGFYIDKYEVTNGRYVGCVAAGACSLPHQLSSDTRPSYFDSPAFAEYPVIAVSWDQANAFCQWEHKRLPTEAEWEKAARGASDSRMYPWGDQSPDCTLANFDREGSRGPCVGDTSGKGAYPRGESPYGALDMAGNVWEWVGDWYSAGYYSVSPASNPQGPATGTDHIRRGGSWRYNAINAGVLTRDNVVSRYAGISTGFRCVRSQ